MPGVRGQLLRTLAAPRRISAGEFATARGCRNLAVSIHNRHYLANSHPPVEIINGDVRSDETYVFPLMNVGQIDAAVVIHLTAGFDLHGRGGSHFDNWRVVGVRFQQPDVYRYVVLASCHSYITNYKHYSCSILSQL